MLNQKDKLELFTDAINKTANEQVRIIEKQMRSAEKKQLEELQRQTAMEYEASLNYELKKLSDEANRKAALLKQESKAVRISHRKQIEDEVFSLVKERLNVFVESEAYKAFLQKSIKEVLSCLKGEAVLYIREKDEITVRDILSAAGEKYTLKLDESNTLGGIKCESADGSLYIDDSLLTRLNSQKEYFGRISGLSIN